MNYELDTKKEITGLDIYYYLRNRLGEKLEERLTENWDCVRSSGQIVIGINGKLHRISVSTEEL